jgi:hypothetical protein
MLLVGLIIGTLVHDDRSLHRSAVLGAVVSVMWGLVVGVGASSLSTVVFGTILGLINVFFGALVGWAFGAAVRAIHEHIKPPVSSR